MEIHSYIYICNELLTMICILGFRDLIAKAAPAIRPPPPTGITTASMSSTCSTTSSPAVPCPAIISG